MATVKISNLPPATNPVASTSLVPVVQGGITKRATLSQIGPTLNVQAFGAVGDGVTDDMDAFINAVAAIKAAGGGTLFIPNTPNGYYLRRNAGCDLSGADGISIVSDGATLKLQGGTFAQTGSGLAVFYTTSAGCSNITISGLRFESHTSSLVVRYQNGGPDAVSRFDAEAAAGRANINETTSFRGCINLQGESRDITVSDCYFGPGIFSPVSIKKAVATVSIRNVQLINLVMDGINSTSILFSCVRNATITGITSLNHQGSKFDHLFYFETLVENVTISNVVAKNDTYTPGIGVGSVAHLYNTGGVGVDGISFSSISVKNLPGIVFYAWENAKNVTFSSVNVETCGTVDDPVFSIQQSANVAITNVTIDDCPWAFGILGGKNVVVSDFVVRNAAYAFGLGTSYDCDWKISDGAIIDSCGRVISSLNRYAIQLTNNSLSRKLRITNVDFVFTTYVPTLQIVDVRGANSRVELVDCRFRSEFGTCAVIPIFTDNNSTVVLDRCGDIGYSAALTRSDTYGQYMLPFVPEQPQYQHVLTPDSATPSVANKTLFVTANTTATSITNFTNGVQGQEIFVLVNDANTTFDFSSSSLKGNNGVDFAAASGDMVFCKKVGANWYCTIVEA